TGARSRCGGRSAPTSANGSSRSSPGKGEQDSLVPQRDDWIQPGGSSSGPEAEEDADERREAERQESGLGGDRGIPLSQLLERERASDATGEAENAAGHAEDERLDQELEQDVAAPRAQRLADPDLTRPLRDRHQHDVHDADPAHDQRDEGDPGQEESKRLGRLLKGRQQARLVAYGE